MRLNEMIQAQNLYTEAYGLKAFTPKGDLGLINWIYKHNRQEAFLPVTSENKYIFFRDVPYLGRTALAVRLVMGIALPFSCLTSANKRHIDRVAGALGGESSHPEVSAWDETMGHYGFPTDADDEKNIVFSTTIYVKHVGNGIPSPRLTCDSWTEPTKNFLQQHEDLPEGLIFSEYYLSDEHWETNWKLFINNSLSSFN